MNAAQEVEAMAYEIADRTADRIEYRMDDRFKAYLDMLTRVDRYGRIYANYYVRTSYPGELFEIVRASVDEIERLRKKRRPIAPAAWLKILSRAVIKETLIIQMDDLEIIADVMEQHIPIPEDKFRVPRGYDDEKVLLGARAFAEDAVPLRDEFLKYGRPESFIDDLYALIGELEEAIAARNQVSGEVSGARNEAAGGRLCVEMAIDDAMERGLKAARVLDVIMQNRFRDGGPALLEWFLTINVSYVYRSNPGAGTA